MRSAAFGRDWLASADRMRFLDTFDSAAAADPAVAQDRAVAFLSDAGLAGRLFAGMAAALADDPLFDPPLRATRENGHIGAVLFDTAAARLTATIVSASGIAAHPGRSVIVPGNVGVVRYVRAGGVRVRRWRKDDATRLVELAALHPRDGDVVVQDGRSQGHAIDTATRDVAMLTVLLRAGAATEVREFRRDDGALARTASTDDAAARTAMLLTLLRVSGRTDAAPRFGAASRDAAPHARWAAMREWLALDAAGALPRLSEMTADADPGVRAAAAATLDLVRHRSAPCPG